MSDNPTTNEFQRSNIITEFNFPVTKVENGITTLIKPADFLDLAESISVVAVGEGDSAYSLQDYVKRAVRNLFSDGMKYLQILANQTTTNGDKTLMVFLQTNLDLYNTLAGLEGDAQMPSVPGQVPFGSREFATMNTYTNKATFAEAIKQALKKEETVNGFSINSLFLFQCLFNCLCECCFICISIHRCEFSRSKWYLSWY